MNINNIRERLVELEDVILSGLNERSKYKINSDIYIHNSNQFIYNNNFEGTYLDFMFKNIENVHSASGRYECFDERPYYKGLSKCIVQRNYNYNLPQELIEFSKKINFSPWIKIAYLNFIQELCESGTDTNYGDTVLIDISNLQAISKRIHYGVLVMEEKYKDNISVYKNFLDKNDDISIINELKNVDIEKHILNRIQEKAKNLDFNKPEIIVNFFKNIIIPMTIQIELEYIFYKKL